MQILIEIEIQQHQIAIGIVRMCGDAVSDHISPQRLLLRRGSGFPNILDRVWIVTARRRILDVLVCVFTIRIEHKLADSLGIRGSPAQREDGFQNNFCGVGFSCARHAE